MITASITGMDCTDNTLALGYPVPGSGCTPINATAALVGINMPGDSPVVQAAASMLQVGGMVAEVAVGCGAAVVEA
jgi:hypothetical protein